MEIVVLSSFSALSSPFVYVVPTHISVHPVWETTGRNFKLDTSRLGSSLVARRP